VSHEGKRTSNQLAINNLTADPATDAIRITTLLQKATNRRSMQHRRILLTSITLRSDAGHG